MPVSNYTGFPAGLTIGNVPVTMTNPDKVFWVSSTSGSNGNKGTNQRPFATLAYALTQTTAALGQIILIKPGHVETVATAGAITWGTKTSVAVIGLGTGSHRPTFNFTTTASTITMTAANCSIKNCLITGGIDAIVNTIVISGADPVCESIEYRDVTGQCTDSILITSTAARARILDHVHIGDKSTAGSVSAIAVAGTVDAEIQIRRIEGIFSAGAIDCRTTAATDLYVHDVGLFRSFGTGEVFVKDTITGSTGQIGPNINIRLSANTTNITEAITGATFVVVDPIYVVNAPNEKAMLINWTASTDA